VGQTLQEPKQKTITNTLGKQKNAAQEKGELLAENLLQKPFFKVESGFPHGLGEFGQQTALIFGQFGGNVHDHANQKSPRPPPRRDGIPSPRTRNSVPDWVPGGM
jgi:hypothetical protein